MQNILRQQLEPESVHKTGSVPLVFCSSGTSDYISFFYPCPWRETEHIYYLLKKKKKEDEKTNLWKMRDDLNLSETFTVAGLYY